MSETLDDSTMGRLDMAIRSTTPLPRKLGLLTRRLGADPSLFLDLVHALLGIYSHIGAGHDEAQRLHRLLAEAGSAYTVGRDADGLFELQDVVSSEARAAAETSASGAGRAGEHLRAAWSKAYSRDRDPNAAYDHAVKAVEVAARPIVSPKNDKSTLGTTVRDLRAKPEKWTIDLDGDHTVETLTDMADLLWQGMYRHGDESKPLNHTQGQAEAAVHLAVVLVQLFRSGFITLT
jgi:hypothetical protein